MPSLAELGLEEDDSEVGQERAVLEAIYPEMNFISAEEMEIRIELEEDDVPKDDDDENDENEVILGGESPFITVRFTLPPTYPTSSPPKITLPSSSPSRILSPSTILPHLEETATSTHTGGPQIFDLIDTAREHALSLLLSARQEHRSAKEAVLAQKEEADRQIHEAKFGGTKVTKEKFLEWWAKFSDEMKTIERMKKVQVEEEREESGKLTGRQLWERGLAGGADVEEQQMA